MSSSLTIWQVSLWKFQPTLLQQTTDCLLHSNHGTMKTADHTCSSIPAREDYRGWPGPDSGVYDPSYTGYSFQAYLQKIKRYPRTVSKEKYIQIWNSGDVRDSTCVRLCVCLYVCVHVWNRDVPWRLAWYAGWDDTVQTGKIPEKLQKRGQIKPC